MLGQAVLDFFLPLVAGLESPEIVYRSGRAMHILQLICILTHRNTV